MRLVAYDILNDIEETLGQKLYSSKEKEVLQQIIKKRLKNTFDGIYRDKISFYERETKNLTEFISANITFQPPDDDEEFY